MKNIIKIRKYLQDLQNGRKPFPSGFTVSDWNGCVTVHDSIVIAKFGETVCKTVADTYKEFGFKVVEKGIGWRITEAA